MDAILQHCQELREHFRLPSAGHMLATNLHADTDQQAFDRIRSDNGGDEASFRQAGRRIRRDQPHRSAVDW